MSIFPSPGIKQDWTPTVNASAPMTISALVINYAYFYFIGQMCFYDVRIRFTTGTGAGAQVNISAPVSPFLNGFNGTGVATILDAGIIYIGRVALETVSARIAVLRPDNLNWNLAANQLIVAQGFYLRA